MKLIKQVEFLIILLWLSITMWLEKAALFFVLDKVSLKLIQKTVSQRSEKIQLILILFLAFAAAFLVWEGLKKQRTKAISIISLFMCLIMIGLLCALQTLRRDDYWEIRDAYKYGFPGYITHEFVQICGRYFSLFLKSLYQFIPPIPYINSLLFISFILLWAGFCLLSAEIAPRMGRAGILSTGMCMALGIMFMSPNIWEVWFWGGGTIIYGLGVGCVVTAAALMISIELSPDHLSLKTAAAAVLICCACGTSEQNTASICAFSLMIFLFPKIIFRREWNKRNGLLFLLAILLTSFILIFSADLKGGLKLYGSERSDLMIGFGSLPEKIWLSVQVLLQYIYSRIEYVLVFTFISFLIGFCYRFELSAKVICAADAGLLITAVGSLTINSLIEFIPPRVISIPLGWILLALMLSVFFCGSQIRKKFEQKSDMRVISALIPLLLLTVVFHFYQNNFGQVRDIRTAWIERDLVLHSVNNSAEPVKTCAIPVMGSGQADPSDDPSRDFNIVTAYYYGFPSITADHLCPPFE